MTPEFQQKFETVLTAFGMYARGACLIPLKRIVTADANDQIVEQWWCREHGEFDSFAPHDVPLPDLTPELAWRVLVAAHAASRTNQKLENALDDWWFRLDDADIIAEALITAIADALEKCTNG